MDQTFNKWEKRKVYRTLTILPKALEGDLITIDLRNETSVSGILEYVDCSMNMTFQDAALVEYEGTYKYFSSLFVPCRMIRDVIVPSHKPIVDTIKSLLPRKPMEKKQVKKPMTFKRSRALRQQEETKRLVRDILKERVQLTSSTEN